MARAISAYQTEVTVNQTADDSETVLRDGYAYTVSFRKNRLRGTLSLRYSTPHLLYFHGYTSGEWFQVPVTEIRRVEP